MALDFEKISLLNQRLYFELSTAAFFCLSNNFRACSLAMERARLLETGMMDEMAPIGDKIRETA